MELEISSLKSRIVQLEAQSNEYFHMKLQKDMMGSEIAKLQSQIALKRKKIRKLKSKTAKYRKNISEKNSSLKKIENHLKKIWSFLLVFGDKLRRNGLLTTDERAGIRTEYEEWFTLLVSLNNTNSEEIVTKLSDLPVGLLEVLNDSECSCQNNHSQTHASNVYEEQSAILVNSNEELTSEHSHSSYNRLSPQFSSKSNDSNCDERQSEDHSVTASQTVSVQDFVTNEDAFDDELWKLNSGSSIISNNEQIKVESDQRSDFKSSYCLKDLSDTESCHKKNPDLVTDQQCADRTTNDQEVNKNEEFASNNTTSLQMSHNENCTLNPSNVNTSFSNLHSNFKDIDIISEDQNVNSNSKTDKPKFDFTNIQLSSSKIPNNIVKGTKSSNKKISKLNKFKLKIIKGNKFGKNMNRSQNLLQKVNQCTTTTHPKIPFHSPLQSNRSLELDCNSEPKEKSQSQSESVVNNHIQNRRTIIPPGPPMKIMRESQLLEDLKSQEISHPCTKGSFSIDSEKRTNSCSTQLAKKTKLALRKEMSDVAPVRVRGRTLLNRGLLRMRNAEDEDNATPINQYPEEVNQVGQRCNKELGSTVIAQIPECDFFPANHHKKMRLEHKRILTKETSKSINTTIDDAELCKDPNTTETQANLPSNTFANFENNSKNVLTDLLKKAESSKKDPIQDLVFQNLALHKYFKSKRRERNLSRFNFSSSNTFKRGISKFTKHKTIVVNSKRSTKTMAKLTKSKARKDPMISIETSCEQDVQIKSDLNESSVQMSPEVLSNKSMQILGTSFYNGKQDSPDLTSKPACSAVANSERISSKENIFSVSLIEGDSTHPDVQINSVCKTSSVTEKDIEDTVKNANSFFTSISENDTDLEKAQDVGEDQNPDINLFLGRKCNSSLTKEKVDHSIENCLSTDDDDCDCPLVIDENFGVDQQSAETMNKLQCQQFEAKHDKLENRHEFFQKESNIDLVCRNVNEIEDIIKNSNGNGLDIDNSLVINSNLGGGKHCRNSEEISKASQDDNKAVISEYGRIINASVNQHNECTTIQHNSFINIPNASNINKYNGTSMVAVSSIKSSISSWDVEEKFVSNEFPLKRKDLINNDQTLGLEDKIHLKSKEVMPNSKITKNRTQVKRHKTSYSFNKRNYNNRFVSNKKFLNRSFNNVTSKSVIEKFFEEFQNIVFTEENFKQNIKVLSNFFLNPTNFPDNSVILLHTLNYLYICRKNPLLSFSTDGDSSILFPLDEKCIVAVFLLIEMKKKQHLDGLVKFAVEAIYSIIISYKNSLTLFGLASLCRVLTAICKEKGDKLKPVLLCGDLLKRRHDFAPYLIASVASIWKELFQIDSNLPAEECLFHSCVLYGATRRTSKKLHDCFWKSSIEFITKHFTALPLRDVKLSIQMLQQIIQDRCEDESWDNQYLSSALIILASFENWDWIERHLMIEYITPNMNKYGKKSLNQTAFDLFCNMYVEAILLRPGNPLDTILTSFVKNSTREDGHFVQASAALALMRFVLKKNRELPPFLNDWFEHNKDNSKVIKIKSYYETLKLYVNHYQNNNIHREC